MSEQRSHREKIGSGARIDEVRGVMQKVRATLGRVRDGELAAGSRRHRRLDARC
jgi:hypothetical protein